MKRLEAFPRASWWAVVWLLVFAGAPAHSADWSQAQRELATGNYGAVIEQATRALKSSAEDERWHLLLSQALLATGRYPEALQAMTNALSELPRSLRLQWQARAVFLSMGQTEAAKDATEEVLRMVSRRPWDYREASTIVVFGQAALASGADPKRVLDQLFDVAKKADPEAREVYLASGELALAKHDYALAAKRFEEGLKKVPDDPDLQWGLARAYEPSHQSLMLAALESALERNSNHLGSLLLLTEYNIDAEDYEAAGELLDRLQAINPWHPDAWAYRSVLAHLNNEEDDAQEARQKALKFWETNPRVDHLIGLKLSQKYRFEEGSACQRQALKNDPDYLPAKSQLAQDLLRLGEEVEGWELAQELQRQDEYDVTAYNLASLHDTMKSFAVVTNEDFVVRMSASERAIYGDRVLSLLTRAKSNLCAKYGMELKSPTIVEIFPRQKDFAVRTFGMPGNPGYLGVCFGRVVTANSPASQNHPVNWEAVLWHEFCHVVTLQMTRNKMPRWLSEGISVYEELEANPAWGQRMNPQYREMILNGELTPLSELSAAFLTPPSEMHLQFAYYESCLVIEFLIKNFGLDHMKALLRELGEGAEINVALEKHFAPMAKLEPDFEAFARERAEKLAPGMDWTKPEFAARKETRSNRRPPVVTREPSPTVSQNWEEFSRERPTNFWVMTRQAEQLVVEKQWAEAKPLLTQINELYPDYIGDDSAYALLATTHRALGETNEERQVLARWAEKDDEAVDAYRRLMELGVSAQDWAAVALNAERFLAVNPLVAPPYRFLAEAGEKLQLDAAAIAAYRALIELDPADPAAMHFQLARLLHRTKDPAARRHLLRALEEAPRFREALRLLLRLHESGEPAGKEAS